MTDVRRSRHGHSLDPVECRCGECGRKAEFVGGEKVYPHRPDLAHKRFYLCECGAYVGTHPGTAEPLGTPARTLTRRARSDAHAHFDALWKTVGRRKPDGGDPRRRGYRWLAQRMGIAEDQCHIGMMDAAQARRVVEICRPELARMGVTPERR